MKKSQLHKLIREEVSKTLNESMETLPSPFEEFEGVFISKDGGNTGIFITDDPTFDGGEYQTVGEEYKMLGLTVLEVFS